MLIPHDYWVGRDLLDLGVPWITPKSIDFLLKYIKPTHNVLEFGSGGSTVFFAQRAASVISIETQLNWYAKVKERVQSFTNVSLSYETQLLSCANKIEGRNFDIILIDCEPNVCEVTRLSVAKLAKNSIKSGGIIVLDNYKADYCTGIKEILIGKRVEVFNDYNWTGLGTEIYYM